MTRRRCLLTAAVALFGLLLLWLAILGFQIAAAGVETSPRNADVAIVLGAAVAENRPSPVFEERIRHGVALYKAGRVKRLLLTGGRASAGIDAEAVVARRRAIELGVPAAAILFEDRSSTTHENFVVARGVMQGHKLTTAIVVSDPLHMKRALRMAADVGIDATGSPTPTTRFKGWWPRTKFLLREMFFYNVYLLLGI